MIFLKVEHWISANKKELEKSHGTQKNETKKLFYFQFYNMFSWDSEDQLGEITLKELVQLLAKVGGVLADHPHLC